MEAFRTPDERFAEVPDFPYEPRHLEWEGLRLAYLDEGEGPPVVLFHGEPTWSFLYRKLIPPLVESGHRIIAMDQPGFGRSDKPVDVGWYSYDRHVAAALTLFEHLDVRDAAIVVHDWGGPIGLRLATLEAPERVARIVAMDTGLFTGHQRMSDEWLRFRDFVARTEDLPVGMLVERACAQPLPAEVLAAYEAPFPTSESKAGAKAFPLMLPTSPDAPGARAGREAATALLRDSRPALLLWADSDPVLPLDSVGRLVQNLFPTAAELTVIEGAGHFLQEDHGEEVGAIVADWLKSS